MKYSGRFFSFPSHSASEKFRKLRSKIEAELPSTFPKNQSKYFYHLSRRDASEPDVSPREIPPIHSQTTELHRKSPDRIPIQLTPTPHTDKSPEPPILFHSLRNPNPQQSKLTSIPIFQPPSPLFFSGSGRPPPPSLSIRPTARPK